MTAKRMNKVQETKETVGHGPLYQKTLRYIEQHNLHDHAGNVVKS